MSHRPTLAAISHFPTFRMKISICDICYKQDDAKQLTKSSRRVGYRGNSEFNIDLCPDHHETYKLESLPKHIQFSLALDGVNIDDQEAKRLAC